MEFIDLNGEFIKASENVFDVENRSFNYGDSIFETLNIADSEILFWSDHLKRLESALSLFRFKLSVKNDTIDFRGSVLKLAEKNNCSSSARAKINIFRKGSGRYTPDEFNASYLIRTYPKETRGFGEYISGLNVGLYKDMRKIIHPTSNYKTGSSMVYIMAGIHAKENSWDDCLIMNTNNVIVDANYSSAFIVKNGVVKTSPVTEGCIDGIMRKQVIKLCDSNRIPIAIEPIYIDDVLGADELFLTNASQGIKAAASFQDRKFGNEVSKKLFERLNGFLISM